MRCVVWSKYQAVQHQKLREPQESRSELARAFKAHFDVELAERPISHFLG